MEAGEFTRHRGQSDVSEARERTRERGRILSGIISRGRRRVLLAAACSGCLSACRVQSAGEERVTGAGKQILIIANRLALDSIAVPEHAVHLFLPRGSGRAISHLQLGEKPIK
ncbi:hypothetical protein EYF80_048688 [Liparis tanakae]|uniref:Uncharacterized protein n=1 Tax=Liparis tanakae TaxID=230148 RepID=A0A4Z2FJJ5_9TELE|nr:hypothetical protein EYF80_048688 [Liparis tanakae]